MTLGLLPALGGGLGELASTGQAGRLLDGYLARYVGAFERVLYFSYLVEALGDFTRDPKEPPLRWQPAPSSRPTIVSWRSGTALGLPVVPEVNWTIASPPSSRRGCAGARCCACSRSPAPFLPSSPGRGWGCPTSRPTASPTRSSRAAVPGACSRRRSSAWACAAPPPSSPPRRPSKPAPPGSRATCTSSPTAWTPRASRRCRAPRAAASAACSTWDASRPRRTSRRW